MKIHHTTFDFPLGEHDASQLRNGTREYLENISRELSAIAFKNGWDSLAAIFEQARREAREIGIGAESDWFEGEDDVDHGFV